MILRSSSFEELRQKEMFGFTCATLTVAGLRRWWCSKAPLSLPSKRSLPVHQSATFFFFCLLMLCPSTTQHHTAVSYR